MHFITSPKLALPIIAFVLVLGDTLIYFLNEISPQGQFFKTKLWLILTTLYEMYGVRLYYKITRCLVSFSYVFINIIW